MYNRYLSNRSYRPSEPEKPPHPPHPPNSPRKQGGILGGLLGRFDSDDILIMLLILVLIMDGNDDCGILIAALAVILLV